MRFLHVHVLILLAMPWMCGAWPAEIPNPALKGKRSYISRDGVKRTVFQHEATGAQIDFLTNSGICETTPGVKQYSGYLNVGGTYCIYFWALGGLVVWFCGVVDLEWLFFLL